MMSNIISMAGYRAVRAAKRAGQLLAVSPGHWLAFGWVVGTSGFEATPGSTLRLPLSRLVDRFGPPHVTTNAGAERWDGVELAGQRVTLLAVTFKDGVTLVSGWNAAAPRAA